MTLLARNICVALQPYLSYRNKTLKTLGQSRAAGWRCNVLSFIVLLVLS